MRSRRPLLCIPLNTVPSTPMNALGDMTQLEGEPLAPCLFFTCVSYTLISTMDVMLESGYEVRSYLLIVPLGSMITLVGDMS